MNTLTADERNREAKYQLAVHYAKAMMRGGCFTQEQYAKLLSKLHNRYNPIIG